MSRTSSDGERVDVAPCARVGGALQRERERGPARRRPRSARGPRSAPDEDGGSAIAHRMAMLPARGGAVLIIKAQAATPPGHRRSPPAAAVRIARRRRLDAPHHRSPHDHSPHHPDLRRPRPTAPAMVQLDDVVRVFGRGDGQVRALDGVTLSLAAARSPRSWGPRAPGSRRCCSSPPGSTGRRRAASTSASSELGGLGERALARLRRERHRLRLPVLQPARRADRGAERRAARQLAGRRLPRSASASPRARRSRRAPRPPAGAALGRPAAARRDRARPRRRAERRVRRRADGRARHARRPRRAGAPARDGRRERRRRW